MAKVVLASAASKELQSLPPRIYARVLHVLERLARWPSISGAKPLSGRLSGRFRVRTGDYRVQFGVQGDAVVVEKIGHRDGFYEE